MQSNDYDWFVKVIILGDSGVGKTNMASRFCEEKFTLSHMSTIGLEFNSKTIEVEGKRIKFQIWDIGLGEERFRNITKTYYKGAYGVILTYSVIDRSSFENVESWIRSIKENTKEEIYSILVGNKCDLQASAEGRVNTNEGKSLAASYKIPFLEVSAKENLMINEVFQILGKGIKERLVREELKDNSEQGKDNNKLHSNSKRDCC